jgi:signal peptidase I
VAPPPVVPAFDDVPVEPAPVVAGEQPRRRRSNQPAVEHHHRSFLKELPFLVLIAFVLALLIKHFLVQAFYIPSGSMEQTLQVGDRVLVNKVPYHYRDPHRGEIVVFNGLDNFDEGVTFAKPSNPVAKALRAVSSTIGLGAPDEKDYIKRVIGVPGDRVMCCDVDGQVVVTPKGGKPTSLDEPYIFQPDMTDYRYFCDAGIGKQLCPPGATGILVPEGRLWVMGDHRGNSSDSRYHSSDAHKGTVPEDKVVGRAFAIVYPFGRSGLLHVPKQFESVALPGIPLLGGLVGALPLTLLRRRRLRRRP